MSTPKITEVKRLRSKVFETKLQNARRAPELPRALAEMGYQLKRVGHGHKYNCTEYRIADAKGISGDYSALVFCEESDGSWRVLDNKQRYGKLAYDAIGCLVSFFGFTFDAAVEALGGTLTEVPKQRRVQSAKPHTVDNSAAEFVLPARVDGRYSALFAYLISRGIDPNLIKALVTADLLYQAEYELAAKRMPIMVFPIYDRSGTAVGADGHGTYDRVRFKHIYTASSPLFAWRFGNRITKVGKQTPVYYCESPIDAMSLCLLTGYEGMYVSLAGCKDTTLESMRSIYGGQAVLAVDNDDAGKRFTNRHKDLPVLLPKYGKDWNEDLQFIKNKKCAHVSTNDNVKEEQQ